VLRSANITQIEGRVLVTGQDETSGRNYVLLESICGEVVQIPQVREFVELRQHGGLKAGSYLRLTAGQDPAGKLRFDAVDLGDAMALLSDQAFLSENAARLAKEMPEGWGGWLGNLRDAALRITTARHRNTGLGR
jgi:hypothetical protein